MFGLPRCIFPLKVRADLEFPLYHASDSAFRAIRLVTSKEIRKVLSTSDQQERNKLNWIKLFVR